jgi:hypothetical protein
MKKFEEYDKKYADLARTDEQEEPHIQDLARDTTCWYGPHIESFPQVEVKYAVYEAADHEEWQKFRCSLKGQSTRMKLARLWVHYQNSRANAESIKELDVAKIRVHNYLGALKRGGLLDEKGRIIK